MADTARDHDDDLSILIIDDEASLAAGLAAGLAASGHHALVAGSATEALAEIAARPRIGVVVTDIRMPDCDGLDLARRILAERAEEQALEVVVISGHATMETAATAVSTRVSALLYKPFRLAALLEAVNAAMAQARRRRAACRDVRQNSSHLAALETERHQLLEWLDQARERLAALADESGVANAVKAEAAEIARTLRAAPPAAPPGQAAAEPAPLARLRDEVERSTGTVSLLEELHNLAGRHDEATPQAVALADLFARACRFRASDLEEKALVVQHSGWDAPAVWAAPQSLERVLDRVLQAVIEWSPSGSRITVAARPREQAGKPCVVLDFTTAQANVALGSGRTGALALARGLPDSSDPGDNPHGLIAFQVARRRAEAVGGGFGCHGDDNDRMIFRLALPAAPPP